MSITVQIIVRVLWCHQGKPKEILYFVNHNNVHKTLYIFVFCMYLVYFVYLYESQGRHGKIEYIECKV